MAALYVVSIVYCNKLPEIHDATTRRGLEAPRLIPSDSVYSAVGAKKCVFEERERNHELFITTIPHFHLQSLSPHVKGADGKLTGCLRGSLFGTCHSNLLLDF